jgi:hypothetical protein
MAVMVLIVYWISAQGPAGYFQQTTTINYTSIGACNAAVAVNEGLAQNGVKVIARCSPL